MAMYVHRSVKCHAFKKPNDPMISLPYWCWPSVAYWTKGSISTLLSIISTNVCRKSYGSYLQYMGEVPSIQEIYERVRFSSGPSCTSEFLRTTAHSLGDWRKVTGWSMMRQFQSYSLHDSLVFHVIFRITDQSLPRTHMRSWRNSFSAFRLNHRLKETPSFPSRGKCEEPFRTIKRSSFTCWPKWITSI
jgi:hypothetical protein